jgi:protein phosphatase
MIADWPSVDAFPLTDPGLKRSHNEDWVGVYEPDDPEELASSGRLYIVADGVGGASRGERASQYAGEKVLYEFYQSHEPDLADRLHMAIRAANADIFEHTERNDTQDPMGTTFVAASLRGRELVIANVGDSRAYLIRGGQIQQLTRDHSLLQQLIDEDELTPDEVQNFRRKNVIMRSVGADEFVEVDLFRRDVHPGDSLLLCSDGLYKYFPDPNELARLALAGATAQAAQQLVQIAKQRGGSDNITVLIIRLGGAKTKLIRPPAGRAGRKVAPAWDDMPTDTRPPRRRTSGLYIGKYPVTGPVLAALVIGSAILVTGMVTAGLMIGTQLFGDEPVSPANPTAPLATLIPTVTLPATAQPTALVTEQLVTEPAVVATVTTAAPVSTITLESAPICKWKVDSILSEKYRQTWPTTDFNVYQDRFRVLNPGIEPDNIQIGQELRIPWPLPLEPTADGSEPTCPS